MAHEELEIGRPLTLKCGLTLPNRLAKAAMAESWADKDKLPHGRLTEAYRLWADGGWGMILTGNVQVDAAYLGTPEDIAINDHLETERHVTAWSRWAEVAAAHGTPVVMQLNHPGRQSPLGAGTRSYLAKSVAPSAVRVDLGPGCIAKAASAVVFGTPRSLCETEIREVIDRFVKGAQMAFQAGFSGVQVHAAHGYLLAQFLSAKTNKRTDRYGGSPRERARIVVEVIDAIRKSVPRSFCVGIKINSVDHQSAGELQDCLQQLGDIINAGVDFVEVSGGTYEDPKMMASTADNANEKVSASTAAREAFFLEFAAAVRQEFPSVHLMVTGGFRSRLGLEQALKSGACDLVGIGRPSVMEPRLPKTIIFNDAVSDADARLRTRSFARSFLASILGVKSLSGGTETLGYAAEIHRMTRAHM